MVLGGKHEKSHFVSSGISGSAKSLSLFLYRGFLWIVFYDVSDCEKVVRLRECISVTFRHPPGMDDGTFGSFLLPTEVRSDYAWISSTFLLIFLPRLQSEETELCLIFDWLIHKISAWNVTDFSRPTCISFHFLPFSLEGEGNLTTWQDSWWPRVQSAISRIAMLEGDFKSSKYLVCVFAIMVKVTQTGKETFLINCWYFWCKHSKTSITYTIF